MTLDVGVVGVGSMGANHARVYSELRDVNFVGVADADVERAESVGDEFDVGAFATDELLARVDAVSVAVPTRFHDQVVEQCIDAGVHVLVEKPFVKSVERGRTLLDEAAENDVVVQIGHIERFNPAVTELSRIVDDLSPIAIDARRLGPPLDGDRQMDDDIVLDLMIHDIDVVQSILSEQVVDVQAIETADGQHTTANLKFAEGTTVSLTASRVTQKKVRELTVTTEDCHIELDYLSQSLAIHRQSRPEYMEREGNLSYHHAGVTERPLVQTGEPLRYELESFVRAAADGGPPRVTGQDGLRAVALANTISRAASGSESALSTRQSILRSVEGPR